MNTIEKILVLMIGLVSAVFIYHGILLGQAVSEPFIIHCIQIISAAIYVGLLFFQLCVLPKGSLQSTTSKILYRSVLNTALVFLVISFFFSIPSDTNHSLLKILLASSKAEHVWTAQFMLLLFICIMPLLVKNKLTLRWITFSLGVCLLASQVVSAPNNILLNFIHLLSASVWAGSLAALLILLPLRKIAEGKIFLKGIMHLFFPWAAAAFVLLALTEIYEIVLHF